MKAIPDPENRGPAREDVTVQSILGAHLRNASAMRGTVVREPPPISDADAIADRSIPRAGTSTTTPSRRDRL